MGKLVIGKDMGLLGFKINTPSFLTEIVDCAMPRTMGVLKIPLNIFKNYLVAIGDRAIEINDPKLNKIMCDMAIYDQADQYSDNYSKELVDEVNSRYIEFSKKDPIEQRVFSFEDMVKMYQCGYGDRDAGCTTFTGISPKQYIKSIFDI